jgi:prepilin-type N-terminal cleavage/methylation domain-containing protein
VKGSRRAFTLPETLVVLVILMVLASALLPVLYSARNAAKATGCLTNFKSAHLATQLYLQDYDETYMPVNHRPAGDFTSETDRTWVQLILPYAPDFGIFRCPADNSDRPRREATFDADLIPGDIYSQYYTASLRTNLGFNFIYFSPIYDMANGWESRPKTVSQVASPDDTFLYIDSVWKLDSNGEPTGGGSWLVVPPCRYDQSGYDSFSFAGDSSIQNVFTNEAEGWDVGQIGSPLQYGGTWPWHSGKTRMTAITANGSARTLTISQISQGCKLEANWGGWIDDVERYKWDLR